MAGYYNSLYNTYSTGNPVMDSIPSVFGTSTQVLQVNSAEDGLEWAAGGGGTGGTLTPEEILIQNATTGYTSTDGTKLFLSGIDFLIKNQESGGVIQLKDSSNVIRFNMQSDLTALYSPGLYHIYIENAFTSLYTPYLRLKSDGAATGCRFTVTSDELYIKNTVVSKGIHLMDSTDVERVGFSSTSSKMYSPDVSQYIRVDDNGIRIQGSGLNIYEVGGLSSTAFKTDVSGNGEISTTEAGKNINLTTTNTGSVNIASTKVTTSGTTGALVVTGGIASGDGMYCTGTFYNKNSINTDLTNFNQINKHNSSTLPTFSGAGAIYNIFSGTNNSQTITGGRNVAIGFNVLTILSSGSENVAIGVSAMAALTSGSFNMAFGRNSGSSISTTNYNTLFGNTSGTKLTGSGNTCIGAISGTGSQLNAVTNLTCLGYSTSIADNTAWTNSIALGYQASVTASNQCSIGNASLTSIVCNTDNSCDLGTSAIKYKANYSNINVPLYSGQGGTSYTVLNDTNILLNPSGTYTLTLPAAASWLGRVINIKEINTTYAVDSATSNINNNGSTSTVIFGIGTSNSCTLVSDGTNWVVFSRTLSV